MTQHHLAIIVGLAILNGIFSPALIAVFALHPVWYPSFLPAILPLLFLSGIFIPLDSEAPEWITTVADIFPVKHFADAMRAGFLGNIEVQGQRVFVFDWWDVAIVAAWGLLGLVLAARFFSWEPRR